MLGKTKEAIKNEQHIDTGNIGQKTQNDDKQIKTKTTQKIKNVRNTDSTQKQGVNPSSTRHPPYYSYS